MGVGGLSESIKKENKMALSMDKICEALQSYLSTVPTCLEQWPSGSGFPCSKPLGGSKFNSAFHPSKVQKNWVPGTSGNLVVKGKLSPRGGSSLLEAFDPHP